MQGSFKPYNYKNLFLRTNTLTLGKTLVIIMSAKQKSPSLDLSDLRADSPSKQQIIPG